MYVGVRAGGGIGDEIEDPAGDEYELYRVVFDITFFFFVIVILLAIIQGTPRHHGYPLLPWFFLMYLINKDETEHTGQESYVWKMYQERCWDFFPAGGLLPQAV
ncbi:hypothetical protein CRUP_009329 [Coryphaenoides rupestris]|nr:hypothetical protein CRUP_009329 [Coryphaenoides rupestris]